ncbi:MAG: hypothetical protein ACN6OM_08935 [Alcaligenes nematophilus]|uniref:hypothetical protein n=1 Tax=Alcaligenes nematophilus TaxID=2994643 RepID=UPI003D06BC04
MGFIRVDLRAPQYPRICSEVAIPLQMHGHSVLSKATRYAGMVTAFISGRTATRRRGALMTF